MTAYDFLILFFSGLYVLAIFWIVGIVTVSFLNLDEWLNGIQKTALSLVIGLFAVTTGYSMIMSRGGNTVSIVAILLFLAWVLIRSKFKIGGMIQPNFWQRIKKGIDWRSLVIFGFAYVLIFLCQLIKLDAFSKNIPMGALDFPFYITIAEQLNLTGIENTLGYLNYINDISLSSAEPYHFFDLWFEAFLQNVCVPNHLFIYLFVFVPLTVQFGFSALLFCGEWVVRSHLAKDGGKELSVWLIAGLAFSFLFLVGYLPYHKIGLNGFSWLEASLFNNPKFVYSYFLIGFGIPLIFRKSYINLILLAFMVAYCYILYIPVAILILGFYIFKEWKAFAKTQYYPLPLVFIVLVVVLFSAFYSLQPHDKIVAVSNIDVGYFIKKIFSDFFSTKNLLHFIRAFAPQILYFVPFLLVMAVQLKQTLTKKIITSAVIFILIGGVLSYSFHFHVEGWQFLAQLYSPATYTCFFILTLNFLKTNNGVLKNMVVILIAGQLLLSCYVTLEFGNDYAPSVSAEFKSEIEKNAHSFSSIGLYCATHSHLQRSSRNISPYLNYFTGFVKVVPNTWLLQASQIDTENLERVSPEFKSLYLSSPLLKFINDRKLTFDDGIIEFVKENNISFVVWKEQSAVSNLYDSFDRTITDQRSGFNISFFKSSL
jgi:hypothetical protein